MAAVSNVEQLAHDQLQAYNQSDLDAFCACYHSEIQILDQEGQCLSKGIDAFRQRYAHLFAHLQFGAEVTHRLVLNQTCIDDESWWRIDSDSGEISQGRILVRYQEREGKIGLVQFFR